MSSSVQKFETELNGGKLQFEFGKLAGQAHGACTVTFGGTVVLATAVRSDVIRDGIDYFPLMVDYEERLYAAGKIKGSRFIKREGRPSDEAILTSRLVDRSIRPLFDESIRNDIQVIITVLSVDHENDADVLSLIAASAALSVSPIPWHGPIAGVRVGRIGGEWAINPTYSAREKSDLDVFVAGDAEKILMIEAGGKQIPDDTMFDAIQFGHKHLKGIVTTIEDIQKKIGVPKEMVELGEMNDGERAALEKVTGKVREYCAEHMGEVLSTTGKKEQKEALLKLKDGLEAILKDDNEVSKELRAAGVRMVEGQFDEAARRLTLEEGKRVDGRKLDEIRELLVEVGLLPRTHGSGLFSRGATQVLSVVTLGSPGDEQLLDTMEESGKKHFMHHYNFPGFSTGEAKPVRSPGRREIGHGALVEKALEPVLPEREKFPYTIRVVSEVLSSNGSSSQASCCGSTLALMDAGVPITAPVAGIAIGLISDKNDLSRYKILTDIQGVEDHTGDMDFKVAGTRSGITAIQMDTKLRGISLQITKDAIAAAREARYKILDVIERCIPKPREELSEYAPRITTLKIDPEKIREVIGKGGETINKIIDECGGNDVTKIDIEQDGLVMITSTNAEMGKKALDWVHNLTREIEIGEIFEGQVIKIVTDRNTGSEIGAIVELLPGQDGMVHISQFSNERIARVTDVVQVGDKLKVKVMGVDKERGRIELSHKVLNGGAPEQPYSKPRPSPRPFQKGRRPRHDR
ncbi:MAG: polyribonucleotide nucleotidyltransferase [Patescibacteria group bacterium]